MAHVLAIMEQRDGTVKRVSHEALGAARALADSMGGDVYALLIGPTGMTGDELGAFGADTVHVVTDAMLERYQPGAYVAAVIDRVNAGECAAVILPATALGKDLGPRIAASVGCPLVTDVTSISHGEGIVVTRPVYSGKAVYSVKISTTPCVISIRPNVFTPIEVSRAGAVEQRSLPADGAAATGATTIDIKEPERAAMDVAEASIIVSGGRGLKGPEHFSLLEELAQAVGGAVGASRAVVDAGWRPHSDQVGQTGKTVSPSLYFAVGISGAIQHLAGMRTAKVIVAINKDRDAPIFKIADYGIVGDLFDIVPKLTEEIRKIREH